MFDLESKYCFHLRVTGQLELCKEVLKQFNHKYTPLSSISAFEVSKENVEHCHSHIEFDKENYEYHISDKGKTSRSAFFKKHNLAGLYNFQQLTKPSINNIQYCIKDDNIINELNTCPQQLAQIKETVIKIQANMKMEQRHKLLEAFKEEHKHIPKKVLKQINPLDGEKEEIWNPEFPYQLHRIASWIHWYYITAYDKPPPIIHMKEYVLWIASKECDMDTESYYFNIFKD